MGGSKDASYPLLRQTPPPPSPSVSPSRTDEYFVTELPSYEFGRSLHPAVITPLFGGKYRNQNGFNPPPTYLNHHRFPTYDFHTKRLRDDGQVAGEGITSFGHLQDVTFNFSPIQQPSIPTIERYYAYLHVIANTQDEDDAWFAYTSIIRGPRPEHLAKEKPLIPFSHLHRICRILARIKRRTTFVRLIDIMCTIRRFGGQLQLFEWNALIDSTARGWRRITEEDFELALSIFTDMTHGHVPGHLSSSNDLPPLLDIPLQPVKPDIYSFTVLLNIAALSYSQTSVQTASQLLETSQASPTRITHLSLMKHFAKDGDLDSISLTLLKLHQQGHELGLDGINATLHAFSYVGRLATARKVYRVLRHALPAVDSDDAIRKAQEDDEINALRQELATDEFIPIPLSMRPNAITFHTLIQGFSFHGHFASAMEVLSDMLKAVNTDPGAALSGDKPGALKHAPYTISFQVFRSLFLGYAKHAAPSGNNDEEYWKLKNLQAIFDLFVDMGKGSRIPRFTVYFIMVGFDKASGHDVDLLRDVWTKMETEFDIDLGGPHNRLRILKNRIFSTTALAYLRKHGFQVNRPGKFLGSEF